MVVNGHAVYQVQGQMQTLFMEDACLYGANMFAVTIAFGEMSIVLISSAVLLRHLEV